MFKHRIKWFSKLFCVFFVVKKLKITHELKLSIAGHLFKIDLN